MKRLTTILRAPVPKEGKDLKPLQARMLTVQQAVWATKARVVVVFEGFDAAGKGTCIRHLTEGLDPRGFRVVPVSAPTEIERGQHWLQRFWKDLPDPGQITVFDRSWYGRVLVERVEGLAPAKRLTEAYGEINAFEKMLKADGIHLVKIFLAVGKDEQLKRFRARLEDPVKQWKITEEDLRNRRRWNDYVAAGDLALSKCPGWTLIRSDDKAHARARTLQAIVSALGGVRRGWKPDRARMAKLATKLR